MQLFSGNSNPYLATSIASFLANRIADFTPIHYSKVGKFSDGEISVELVDNVRGQDVWVIQSICAPTNDNLMELVLLIDALRRSSARSISALIPYFGYARQDRRARSARVPISAKVVADMITRVGVERVVTVELHADQIQGFFEVPVDNVYTTKHFADDINRLHLPNLSIVSPDVGGVLRARSLAKQVGDADLIIIDKRRPRPNESEIMNIIGEVEGKNCIIVDDIIDTAGTICKAVQALYDYGAVSVRAYGTHAVLSGEAIARLSKSKITELVVTDTIPIDTGGVNCPIRTLTVADLLAEVIFRIVNGISIKDLQ